MNTPRCENCKYYRQHYIRLESGQFMYTSCGHCVYPRLKHRKPFTTACISFESSEAGSQETADPPCLTGI